MQPLFVFLLIPFLASSAFGFGNVDFRNSAVTSPIRNSLRDGALVTQEEGILVALYMAPLSDPDNFVQLGGPAVVSWGPPLPTGVPGQFFGGFRNTGPAVLEGMPS